MLRQSVFDRLIDLTLLDVGVTAWNVWDLPVWMWRHYADLVDEQRRKAREEERNRG